MSVRTRSTDRKRTADRPAGVRHAPVYRVPCVCALQLGTREREQFWTVDTISEDKETMEVLPVPPQFAGFDSEKGEQSARVVVAM